MSLFDDINAAREAHLASIDCADDDDDGDEEDE